jgi:hypothetical protein
MNHRSLLALALLLCAVSGCRRRGDPAIETAATVPMEDWATVETRARDLATANGHLVEETPIDLQGFVAESSMSVEGGKCYTVALAWPGPNAIQLGVGFQPGPSGRPVSEAFASRSRRVEAPGGSFEFCADNGGSVNLTVSSIAPTGAIDVNASGRYALALAVRGESGGETAARQQGEAGQAAATQAWMDGNVRAAEERRARDQAQRCRQCDEDYRLCQVGSAARRQHPRPGVTVSTSCDVQYRECGFPHRAAALSAASEWPCGRPPRCRRRAFFGVGARSGHAGRALGETTDPASRRGSARRRRRSQRCARSRSARWSPR